MNRLLKQNSIIVSCHLFKKVLRFGANCKGICSKGLFIAADILKKQPSRQHVFTLPAHMFMSCLFFLFRFKKTAVLCWCLSTLVSFKIFWILLMVQKSGKPFEVEVGSLSHYLQGFSTTRGWLAGFLPSTVLLQKTQVMSHCITNPNNALL